MNDVPQTMDEPIGWATTLEEVIGRIVTNPEAVNVRTSGPAQGRCVFEVDVADEDVGRVIGRGSRTLRALTGLTHTWAKMRGWEADLTLLNAREFPPGSRDPRRPFGRHSRNPNRQPNDGNRQ